MRLPKKLKRKFANEMKELSEEKRIKNRVKKELKKIFLYYELEG